MNNYSGCINKLPAHLKKGLRVIYSGELHVNTVLKVFSHLDHAMINLFNLRDVQSVNEFAIDAYFSFFM